MSFSLCSQIANCAQPPTEHTGWCGAAFDTERFARHIISMENTLGESVVHYPGGSTKYTASPNKAKKKILQMSQLHCVPLILCTHGRIPEYEYCIHFKSYIL